MSYQFYTNKYRFMVQVPIPKTVVVEQFQLKKVKTFYVMAKNIISITSQWHTTMKLFSIIQTNSPYYTNENGLKTKNVFRQKQTFLIDE